MLLVIVPSPRTGVKSNATDVATVSPYFHDSERRRGLTNEYVVGHTVRRCPEPEENEALGSHENEGEYREDFQAPDNYGDGELQEDNNGGDDDDRRQW